MMKSEILFSSKKVKQMLCLSKVIFAMNWTVEGQNSAAKTLVDQIEFRYIKDICVI